MRTTTGWQLDRLTHRIVFAGLMLLLAPGAQAAGIDSAALLTDGAFSSSAMLICAAVLFAMISAQQLATEKRTAAGATAWLGLLSACLAACLILVSPAMFVFSSGAEAMARALPACAHLCAALAVPVLAHLNGKELNWPARVYQWGHVGFVAVSALTHSTSGGTLNVMRAAWCFPLVMAALWTCHHQWRTRESLALAPGSLGLLASSAWLCAAWLVGTPTSGAWTMLMLSGAVTVGAMWFCSEWPPTWQETESAMGAMTSTTDANDMKRSLKSQASRSVQSPIEGMLGLTEVLLESPLDPAQRENVRRIQSHGQDVLKQLSDLLDSNVQPTDAPELDAGTYDLRAMVEDAVDQMTPRAESAGLGLEYEFEDDVPEVIVGDEARSRQILLNLVNNSVRLADQGDVSVTMGSATNKRGQTSLHLRVSNDGPGLPPEQAMRIFGSGQWKNTGDTMDHGDTGLSLCKRMCELMGGTLWTDQDADGRTTFHFKVPCSPAPPHRRDWPAHGSLHLMERSVLIVGAGRLTQEVLANHCRRWGMSAFIAADDIQARKALMGRSFDVVLLDRRSGMETDDATRARLLAQIDETPYAILGGQHDTAESLGLTQTPLVNSPIKPSSLHGVLQELLTTTTDVEKGEGSETSSRTVDDDVATQHPLNVLVAENDPLNRQVVLGFLSRFGYRADWVSEGQECIAYVENHACDLILMGSELTGKNVLETTRSIRARWKDNPRPRIVTFVGDGTREQRAAFLEAGMDDYSVAPIRAIALKALLETSASALEFADKQPTGVGCS